MAPLLTVLVNSRITGNSNWGLLDLLEDLQHKSASHKNFEVCVKFDSDDEPVAGVLPKLAKFPFAVKYVIEPRGRGYEDMHLFLYRAFRVSDPNTVAVGSVPDDMYVNVDGWDEHMLGKCRQWDDGIFIIHGEPHPPPYRSNVQTEKFWPYVDLRDVDLHPVDPCPWWSRRLIEICRGFGPTWSADTWTLHLEWELFHTYGIERTAFTEQPLFLRKMNPAIDMENGERWTGVRLRTHDFFLTDAYKAMVRQEARDVALNILAGELVEGRAKAWSRIKPKLPDQALFEREMSLGIAAFNAGQRASTARILGRLAERFPENALCHSVLGMALIDTGRFGEAVAILSHAAGLAPRDAVVRGNLGVARYLAGDHVQGEEDLRCSLELDTANGGMAVALTHVLQMANRGPEALRLLERLAPLTSDPAVQSRIAQLRAATPAVEAVA